MLSSTRWTSTVAGSTTRAPFALSGFGNVPQTSPELEAQWLAFLKEFDNWKLTPAQHKAIIDLWNKWSAFEGNYNWYKLTSAPNLAPWIADLTRAKTLLEGYIAAGAERETRSGEATGSAGPAIKLQEEHVFGAKPLAIGLVGLALLFFWLGSSQE